MQIEERQNMWWGIEAANTCACACVTDVRSSSFATDRGYKPWLILGKQKETQCLIAHTTGFGQPKKNWYTYVRGMSECPWNTITLRCGIAVRNFLYEWRIHNGYSSRYIFFIISFSLFRSVLTIHASSLFLDYTSCTGNNLEFHVIE